jgi:hypothetical protein
VRGGEVGAMGSIVRVKRGLVTCVKTFRRNVSPLK